MTEQEAKAKWCPAARIDSTGSNRPNPGPAVDVQGGWAPCIGSACMAWRWDVSPENANRQRGSIYEKPGGFCGLAGKE